MNNDETNDNEKSMFKMVYKCFGPGCRTGYCSRNEKKITKC